jgi:hypothetical protein
LGAPAFEAFDRYGLGLVDEPAPEPLVRPAPAEELAPPPSGLDAFHWSLLVGFVALQLSYLVALARFAAWAVHRLMSA